MFAKIFVFSAFLALSVKANERIIGGEEAEPNSLSYMALNIYLGKPQCGAVILDERTIITASHCIDGRIIESVVVGEHDYTIDEGTEQKIKVSGQLMHPDFDRSKLINDIALLYLEKDIEFNENVQPIELPERNQEFEVGAPSVVSGWGCTDPYDCNRPTALRVAPSPVISYEECQEVMDEFDFHIDTDLMICSGGDGNGGCQGDSGGPLVLDNVLVGIVTGGLPDCTIRHGSFFAKVSAFVDFLIENAQGSA